MAVTASAVVPASAYVHGHMPIVALKGPGFDELGDHFSPIWAVLAPVYWIFPTAYTLLIAQAVLLAIGAVPLVSWAEHAAGHRTALAIGAGYGLSWGVASAAGFDVHEIAFAVPLLAYSTTALGHRRWRAAAAWALPLLLVKEDLGITLAAIGVYIAAHGARRLGLAVMATGTLGTLLEIKVLIPALNPGHRYGYTSSISGAVHSGISGLLEIFLQFITPETKITTVVLMLAITGFLALRSPITLLVVPTLTWRFLANNPDYWGTAFQYSAVLMPIVFAGFVDALSRLRTRDDPLVNAITRAGLVTGLTVTAMLLPDYSLWALAQSSTWHADSRTAIAHQIIAEIPANATVATTDQLAPQLTDRDTVSLFDDQTPAIRPAWVLVDTESTLPFPLTPGQQAQLIDQLHTDGYQVAANRDGYVLLKRASLVASAELRSGPPAVAQRQ